MDGGSLNVVAQKTRHLHAFENGISESEIAVWGQGEKSPRISPPGLEISYSTYSLSQNGWDTLGSPCPLNVGVQDLVTKPR